MRSSEALGFVDRWSDLIRMKSEIYSRDAQYDADDCIQIANASAIEAWRTCTRDQTKEFKREFWDVLQKKIQRQEFGPSDAARRKLKEEHQNMRNALTSGILANLKPHLSLNIFSLVSERLKPEGNPEYEKFHG